MKISICVIFKKLAYIYIYKACASFLDLNIRIVSNKFHLNLYDKRDTFPFSVVRMSYLLSNIPSKIFCASIAAEALRIDRSCTDSKTFGDISSTLITHLTKQGAKHVKLMKALTKF